MKSILSIPEKVWEFEIEIYNRLMTEDFRYSLMPSAERKFINGMIRYFKPFRILELGVCDGGGSIVILNAIEDMPEAKLISIELSEMSTNNIKLKSGHAAIAKYPQSNQWEFYSGKEPSEIIEELGKDGMFDFVVIDTLHIHPGETFNFLTILPYLTDNAIVIIQDISLYAMFVGLHSYPHVPLNRFPNIPLAPRLLWDALVGEKIILPVEEYEDDKSWDIIFSNIGAIQINNDTCKYIGNLFSILEFPWGIVPKKVRVVSQFIKRHYPDKLYRRFLNAYEKNAELLFNRGVLYHYSDSKIDFSGYEKIIFYGCGQFIKDIFLRRTSPVIPDEIWDYNAEVINEGDISFLEGIPLIKPNLEYTDKKSIAIIVTISNANIIGEVLSLLRQNGFTSVFKYSECW